MEMSDRFLDGREEEVGGILFSSEPVGEAFGLLIKKLFIGFGDPCPFLFIPDGDSPDLVFGDDQCGIAVVELEADVYVVLGIGHGVSVLWLV